MRHPIVHNIGNATRKEAWPDQFGALLLDDRRIGNVSRMIQLLIHALRPGLMKTQKTLGPFFWHLGFFWVQECSRRHKLKTN